MATQPIEPPRKGQSLEVSRDELLRRAKPYVPPEKPVLDDLSEEEEEEFWAAINS